MTAYVNEQTLVGEVVRQYPEAIDVLLGVGMHCLGCPASQAEALEDAAMVHGLEPKTLVDAINETIAKTRA